MPEPRETVAEVLRAYEHTFIGVEKVADAVLAALTLTQEWGASDVEEPDDPGAWMADRDWAERHAKSEGGKVFTRFVTPWVGCP